MVRTVPGPILLILPLAAGLIVGLVTWGVLRWALNWPAEEAARPAIPVCPECGTPLSAGMCPRCMRPAA